MYKKWQWQFEELEDRGLGKRQIYELIAKEHGLKPRYVGESLCHVIRDAWVIYGAISHFLPDIFEHAEEVLSVETIAQRLAEQRPWVQKWGSSYFTHIRVWPRPKTLERLFEEYGSEEYQVLMKIEFPLEEVAPGQYKLKATTKPPTEL